MKNVSSVLILLSAITIIKSQMYTFTPLPPPFLSHFIHSYFRGRIQCSFRESKVLLIGLTTDVLARGARGGTRKSMYTGKSLRVSAGVSPSDRWAEKDIDEKHVSKLGETQLTERRGALSSATPGEFVSRARNCR